MHKERLGPATERTEEEQGEEESWGRTRRAASKAGGASREETESDYRILSCCTKRQAAGDEEEGLSKDTNKRVRGDTVKRSRVRRSLAEAVSKPKTKKKKGGGGGRTEGDKVSPQGRTIHIMVSGAAADGVCFR